MVNRYLLVMLNLDYSNYWIIRKVPIFAFIFLQKIILQNCRILFDYYIFV